MPPPKCLVLVPMKDFERKVAECEVDLWEIKSAQVFEQFATSAAVMDLVAHWSVHLKEKLLMYWPKLRRRSRSPKE